ncbi:MAG: cysteine desulfurase [Lachnospiraceae bacterium]|nr:cysteine desulfurase [Lachnospiraceae bacterium]
MQVYLDNSATTRCMERVTDKMIRVMREDYGNPSSLHTKGVEAEQYIKEAKEFFAKNLKVNEKEIYFTSGGTESNNMAIIGTALANQRAGKHLITSSVEHASVANTMKYLEEQGFTVTYLPVDTDGIVSVQDLKEALTDETIFVSIMYVNNEIGAVQPIDEIAKIIKEQNPKTLFHVDAIQAYGKYEIYPKKEKIDLLSISGHKIHGPKGSGVLYVNEKVKIRPIVFGGDQQKGLRSGTENVPGIAGIAEAAKACYENLNEKIEHLYTLKAHFIEGIQKLEGTRINGRTDRDSAPHIVSVSFRDVRSEVLLHALEEKGIYVSAGSACSSNKPAVSRTLKSIGVEKELLGSTLRFSFCFETTEEEIDYCLQKLRTLLPVLRRYVRR